MLINYEMDAENRLCLLLIGQAGRRGPIVGASPRGWRLLTARKTFANPPYGWKDSADFLSL